MPDFTNAILNQQTFHAGGAILPDKNFHNSMAFVELGILVDDVERYNTKHAASANKWTVFWHNGGFSAMRDQLNYNKSREDMDYNCRYGAKQLDNVYQVLTLANRLGAVKLIDLHNCDGFGPECFKKHKETHANVIVITDKRFAQSVRDDLREASIFILTYEGLGAAELLLGCQRLVFRQQSFVWWPCGREFNYNCGFCAQMQVNADVELREGFPCKTCKKYFVSLQSLKRHQKVHGEDYSHCISSVHPQVLSGATKSDHGYYRLSTEGRLGENVLAGRLPTHPALPITFSLHDAVQSSRFKDREIPSHSSRPLKSKARVALFGKSGDADDDFRPIDFAEPGTSNSFAEPVSRFVARTSSVHPQVLAGAPKSDDADFRAEGNSLSSLTRHQKTIEKDNYHGLSTERRRNQNVSAGRLTTQPMFSCDCGKAFSTAKGFRAHKNIAHSQLKPFSCDQCGKSFKTRGGLKQHQLVHSDERQYSCFKCGKSFKSNGHLRDHRRRRHCHDTSNGPSVPHHANLQRETDSPDADDRPNDFSEPGVSSFVASLDAQSPSSREESMKRPKNGTTPKQLSRKQSTPKLKTKGKMEELTRVDWKTPSSRLESMKRRKNETTPKQPLNSQPLSRMQFLVKTWRSLVKGCTREEFRYLAARHPPCREKMNVLVSAVGRRKAVIRSEANKKLSLLKRYSAGRILSRAQYQSNINSDVKYGGRKVGNVRLIPFDDVQRFANSLLDRQVNPLTTLDPSTKVKGGYVELRDAVHSLIKAYDTIDRKHESFLQRRAQREDRRRSAPVRVRPEEPRLQRETGPASTPVKPKEDWPLLSKQFSKKTADGVVDVYYVLSADGAPNGFGELTSYAVSIANLGGRIRSHCYNLLLCGADASESNPIFFEHYNPHLSKSVDELEGTIYRVQDSTYRIRFGILGGDLKWLSATLGELTNSSTFPRPGFRPWTFDHRVEVAGKVTKHKLREKRRHKITEFIAALQSRQEYMPSVSRLMCENISPDPLHASINCWKDWFDWLLGWTWDNSGNLQVSAGASHGKLARFIEDNEHAPVSKLLVKVREVHYPLYRLIEKRFDAGISIDTIPLKGNEARALSKHCMKLVGVLWNCEEFTKPRHDYLPYKLAAIGFSGLMLAQSCALFSAFETNKADLEKLATCAKLYYSTNSLFRERRAQAVHWHVGVALPFYATRLFERLGCGSGIGDMNGRESNHTVLKYFAKHASRREDTRWKSIFCHDFITKEYLPKQFGLAKSKESSLSFCPERLPGHCRCSLPLINSACSVCNSSVMLEVISCAEEHGLTSNVAALSKSYLEYRKSH